ncbi:MAG TPA: PIN domain-containing protein [Gammaproteobacteria bacterium]|nr:PIN domain-containing protein [Gammaproteobacteria bacterium]
MKILFDTSVLIAGLVQSHPKHDRALPWLVRAVEKKDECYLCVHTLMETYAVLTSLPVSPRISPSVALNLIESNFKKHFQIITLTTQDHWKLLTHLVAQGLMGGVSYDGLLCQAALKAGVDKILTFNQKDFKRLLEDQTLLLIPE